MPATKPFIRSEDRQIALQLTESYEANRVPVSYVINQVRPHNQTISIPGAWNGNAEVFADSLDNPESYGVYVESRFVYGHGTKIADFRGDNGLYFAGVLANRLQVIGANCYEARGFNVKTDYKQLVAEQEALDNWENEVQRPAISDEDMRTAQAIRARDIQRVLSVSSRDEEVRFMQKAAREGIPFGDYMLPGDCEMWWGHNSFTADVRSWMDDDGEIHEDPQTIEVRVDRYAREETELVASFTGEDARVQAEELAERLNVIAAYAEIRPLRQRERFAQLLASRERQAEQTQAAPQPAPQKPFISAEDERIANQLRMYRILQDEESLRALADMAEHNDAWQEIKADEWTAENVALVPAALVSPNDPTRLKAVEADEAEFWCVQIGQMPILDSGEINQEANEGVYRNRETAETRAHRARVIDAYATLDAQEQAQKFARLVADEEPHVLRIMRDGLEDIGILVSDYDFAAAKGFLRAVRKEDEHALWRLEEDGNGWSFRREPSGFSDGGEYHLSPNWDGIARVRGFVVTDAENDTYRPAESHETPDFYHVAAGGYYLEESYIPDWLRDEPDHPAWENDRLHLRDVRFTGEDGLEQAEELAQRLSAMDVLATPDMEQMREKFDRLVNEEFARRNGVSLSHTDLVFADYLRDMRTTENADKRTVCLDERYFVPGGDWGPAPVAVKATAYINVYKVCVGRFGREVARFSPIPNKERCECVTLTSDDPFNSEEMRFELDGTPWDNAVRLADRLRVIDAYATLSPTSQRSSFKYMASKLRGDLKDVVPQREQAQETAPQMADQPEVDENQRAKQGSAVCVPTQSQTGQWGLNITTAEGTQYRDVGVTLDFDEEEIVTVAKILERGDNYTLSRCGIALDDDDLWEVRWDDSHVYEWVVAHNGVIQRVEQDGEMIIARFNSRDNATAWAAELRGRTIWNVMNDDTRRRALHFMYPYGDREELERKVDRTPSSLERVDAREIGKLGAAFLNDAPPQPTPEEPTPEDVHYMAQARAHDGEIAARKLRAEGGAVCVLDGEVYMWEGSDRSDHGGYWIDPKGEHVDEETVTWRILQAAAFSAANKDGEIDKDYIIDALRQDSESEREQLLQYVLDVEFEATEEEAAARPEIEQRFQELVQAKDPLSPYGITMRAIDAIRDAQIAYHPGWNALNHEQRLDILRAATEGTMEAETMKESTKLPFHAFPPELAKRVVAHIKASVLAEHDAMTATNKEGNSMNEEQTEQPATYILNGETYTHNPREDFWLDSQGNRVPASGKAQLLDAMRASVEENGEIDAQFIFDYLDNEAIRIQDEAVKAVGETEEEKRAKAARDDALTEGDAYTPPDRQKIAAAEEAYYAAHRASLARPEVQQHMKDSGYEDVRQALFMSEDDPQMEYRPAQPQRTRDVYAEAADLYNDPSDDDFLQGATLPEDGDEARRVYSHLEHAPILPTGYFEMVDGSSAGSTVEQALKIAQKEGANRLIYVSDDKPYTKVDGKVVKQVDQVGGHWWVRHKVTDNPSTPPSIYDTPLSELQEHMENRALFNIEVRHHRRQKFPAEETDYLKREDALHRDKKHAQDDIYDLLIISNLDKRAQAAALMLENWERYPTYRNMLEFGSDKTVPRLQALAATLTQEPPAPKPDDEDAPQVRFSLAAPDEKNIALPSDWNGGTLEIRACVTTGHDVPDGKECVEPASAHPDREPEFWGVYARLTDGTQEWMQDFDSLEDAQRFAQSMVQQQVTQKTFSTPHDEREEHHQQNTSQGETDMKKHQPPVLRTQQRHKNGEHLFALWDSGKTVEKTGLPYLTGHVYHNGEKRDVTVFINQRHDTNKPNFLKIVGKDADGNSVELGLGNVINKYSNGKESYHDTVVLNVDGKPHTLYVNGMSEELHKNLGFDAPYKDRFADKPEDAPKPDAPKDVAADTQKQQSRKAATPAPAMA